MYPIVKEIFVMTVYYHLQKIKYTKKNKEKFPTYFIFILIPNNAENF